jgi:excisionase family DNA binding protein
MTAHVDEFESGGTSPPRGQATAPDYLTVPEVARLLRVSVASVYRLASADPTFPVLRLPGVMRFPRARLEKWLREHEQGQGRPRGIRSQVLSPGKGASTQEATRA